MCFFSLTFVIKNVNSGGLFLSKKKKEIQMSRGLKNFSFKNFSFKLFYIQLKFKKKKKKWLLHIFASLKMKFCLHEILYEIARRKVGDVLCPLPLSAGHTAYCVVLQTLNVLKLFGGLDSARLVHNGDLQVSYKFTCWSSLRCHFLIFWRELSSQK